MARIMDIKKCERPVRVNSKTVMEVNFDRRYFSMWVHAAGQEGGAQANPPSMQLDVEKAKRLRAYLTDFIEEENGSES